MAPKVCKNAMKRPAKKHPAGQRPAKKSYYIPKSVRAIQPVPVRTRGRKAGVCTEPKLAEPWLQPVAGPEHPNWAHRFVHALRTPLSGLQSRRSGKIVVWSDCAGKCSEQHASQLLAAELKNTLDIDIEFELYGVSESQKHCRAFVEANYAPQHLSHDIFARDFSAATFECAKCNATHSLPTVGVISTGAAFRVGRGALGENV